MLLSLAACGLLSLLVISAPASGRPSVSGNGVLTCRPGVKFLRDCGNECTCHLDGKGADCTSKPCPKDFETSMREEVERVYHTMEKLRNQDKGPVFTCEPRTSRKINDFGCTCFCTTNGKAEICSEHPSSPWGF